jgi:hypothetical protein
MPFFSAASADCDFRGEPPHLAMKLFVSRERINKDLFCPACYLLVVCYLCCVSNTESRTEESNPWRGSFIYKLMCCCCDPGSGGPGSGGVGSGGLC